MDKLIAELLRRLKIQYALFWAVIIGLFLGFETDLLPVGLFAGDIRMEYILQTAGILLMIALVPLSLKIFNLVLTKKIDSVSLEEAIKLYRTWSLIRLLLLLVAGVFNLAIYYFTLNSTAGFCVVIVLVASFFCLPGEGRIKKELHIGNADEQQ